MIAGVAMTLLLVPRMLRQRRSAASMTAWLMAILLIPWIGIPAYLVLGGRKLDAALMLKPPLGSAPPAAALPPGEAGADQLLQSYGLPRAQSGNRFSLCADGVEIYKSLSKSSRAQRTVSIWRASSCIRTRLGSPLSRRWRSARAGVEVRLLLDGFGSFHTSKRSLDPLIRAGGKAALFLPVRSAFHPHQYAQPSQDADRRRPDGGRGRRQCRGGIYGTGPTRGAGATSPSCSRARPCATTQPFSPPTGRSSPATASKRLGAAAPAGEALVQVAPSGPDVPGDPVYAAIVSAAFAARRRLWIVTPYFIPPEGLGEALALAAHRGVDVRVYVPDTSNHLIADLARGQPLRDAAAAGVTVIRFVGGMVHAKIVLVDNWLAMVGSVNIDPRSLFLNFEANAIVYGPNETAAVAKWIENACRTRRRRASRAGVRFPRYGRGRRPHARSAALSYVVIVMSGHSIIAAGE